MARIIPIDVIKGISDTYGNGSNEKECKVFVETYFTYKKDGSWKVDFDAA